MANKRELKQMIRRACGDVAVEAIMADNYLEGSDTQALRQIVLKAAMLQQSFLAHTTFDFDKARRDYDNKAEYNKARHDYYAKAYRTLRSDFVKELQQLVTELNAAIPAAVREAVK